MSWRARQLIATFGCTKDSEPSLSNSRFLVNGRDWICVEDPLKLAGVSLEFGSEARLCCESRSRGEIAAAVAGAGFGCDLML